MKHIKLRNKLYDPTRGISRMARFGIKESLLFVENSINSKTSTDCRGLLDNIVKKLESIRNDKVIV